MGRLDYNFIKVLFPICVVDKGFHEANLSNSCLSVI